MGQYWRPGSPSSRDAPDPAGERTRRGDRRAWPRPWGDQLISSSREPRHHDRGRSTARARRRRRGATSSDGIVAIASARRRAHGRRGDGLLRHVESRGRAVCAGGGMPWEWVCSSSRPPPFHEADGAGGAHRGMNEKVPGRSWRKVAVAPCGRAHRSFFEQGFGRSREGASSQLRPFRPKGADSVDFGRSRAGWRRAFFDWRRGPLRRVRPTTPAKAPFA